jgi:hypothetical protein
MLKLRRVIGFVVSGANCRLLVVGLRQFGQAKLCERPIIYRCENSGAPLQAASVAYVDNQVGFPGCPGYLEIAAPKRSAPRAIFRGRLEERLVRGSAFASPARYRADHG